MRRIALIVGAVVVSLVLSACGTAGGDHARDVEVFSWWTERGEKAGLDGLVTAFHDQYPQYRFVNAAVAGGAGGNAKHVLASRLQSQDPPASFQAHAGAELQDYISAGQLQDLTSLYQQQGWLEVFPDAVVDLLTYRGKIYSVPANVHRANLVWANPAVLRRAGVADPPTSIEEWIKDLRRLRDSGVEYPLAVGTGWTQVHLLETVLIARLGAQGYTGLWNGGMDWRSPEVTQALSDYRTLLSFANPDRSSLDWPDAMRYVTTGRAGYTVMGDWAAGSLKKQHLTQGTDWVWFPVPGTAGVFDFIADSFTLPVGAPNVAGARAWLTVVGSVEGQRAFNTHKGSIPVRSDAVPKRLDRYQKAAIASFQEDTIVPSLTHGAAVSVDWLTDIGAVVVDLGATGDVAACQRALVLAAKQHAPR